jgi:acyl-CoA thioesterase-1
MAATADIRMIQAMTPYSTRRAVLGALAALATGPALAADRPRVVTMLGDSITAGYGLAASEALPARLGQALGRLGLSVVVRAAGVSGDTSADALARVGFSVQPDTDLCLVALGGNDLLQGVEPAVLRDNLRAIVRKLKAREIAVLLAGMRAPPAIGAPYAKAFDAVYPDLARAEHVGLYPYLLDGVALNPRLNQKDGIHPNPAGVTIIAGRLAPVVARALAGRR